MYDGEDDEEEIVLPPRFNNKKVVPPARGGFSGGKNSQFRGRGKPDNRQQFSNQRRSYEASPPRRKSPSPVDRYNGPNEPRRPSRWDNISPDPIPEDRAGSSNTGNMANVSESLNQEIALKRRWLQVNKELAALKGEEGQSTSQPKPSVAPFVSRPEPPRRPFFEPQRTSFPSERPTRSAPDSGFGREDAYNDSWRRSEEVGRSRSPLFDARRPVAPEYHTDRRHSSPFRQPASFGRERRISPAPKVDSYAPRRPSPPPMNNNFRSRRSSPPRPSHDLGFRRSPSPPNMGFRRNSSPPYRPEYRDPPPFDRRFDDDRSRHGRPGPSHDRQRPVSHKEAKELEVLRMKKLELEKKERDLARQREELDSMANEMENARRMREEREAERLRLETMRRRSRSRSPPFMEEFDDDRYYEDRGDHGGWRGNRGGFRGRGSRGGRGGPFRGRGSPRGRGGGRGRGRFNRGRGFDR